MELITGINKVMAYTEENLKGELDPKKIALLCGCPYAEFQRMFSLINNMSYLEYVRARKLSQAGPAKRLSPLLHHINPQSDSQSPTLSQQIRHAAQNSTPHNNG